MPSLRAVLDLIPFVRRHRAWEAVVDTEAISLIRANDTGEAAYQQARDVSRLAREQGDRDGARLYARVAMRIADVTGRTIGPVDGGQQRYSEPTREIDGERTRPVSRQ
jgi:hypothetical protein